MVKEILCQIHPNPADKTHIAKIIAEYTEYNYRRSMGWTRARACPASERSSNGRWLPFITATVKARAGIRSTRIPLRGFAEVHEDAPVGSLLSWLRKEPCACGRLDCVDFDEIGRNDTRTTRSRIVGRTIVSGKRRRWSNEVDSLR